MRGGLEIFLSLVDDEIPLTAHAAAHDGARNAVQLADFVAEAVALGCVSFLVASQGVHVLRAEVVLRGDRLFFHDVADAHLLSRGLREVEIGGRDILAERHDVNALAVLGHSKIFRVENLVEDLVAHLFERARDDFERLALVVDGKTLHVFAENHLGLVVRAYARHIEEQRAARHALVVIVETHAVPSKAERLAGEARKADVKLRHVLLVNLGDVAVDGMHAGEIGAVSFLSEGIPLRHEHGLDVLAKRLVESHADAADAREKVNGAQFAVLGRALLLVHEQIAHNPILDQLASNTIISRCLGVIA